VMGLTRRNLRWLRIAAALHDIGKISVAENIVAKPGLLDGDEWKTMRKHAELGAEIVNQVAELADCAPAIRHHHERYEGGGYPDGVRGEEIPLEARIVAVADAYDNMITQRPYIRAFSPLEALEELNQRVNQEFDPNVLLALSRVISAG